MIIINFTHNNADHHYKVSIMIVLIVIISYSSLLSTLYGIYLYNDNSSTLLICRLSLSQQIVLQQNPKIGSLC
jgi:hypothetical protein